MSVPTRLKRALLAGVCGVLIAPAAVANAVPDSSLCKMDTARGAVPAKFPLQACIDTGGVQMRNQLDVPVWLTVSGDTKPMVKLSTDMGAAAIATRMLHPDPRLIMPGDHLRVPLGTRVATLRVDPDPDAYRTYIFATTMLAYVPAGKIIETYEVFTGLIKDWSAAFANYQTCLARANWIQQIGCNATLKWDVTFAFGKAAVLGLGSAILKIIMSPTFYAQWLANQPPSIGALLFGDRTIPIAAKMSAGSSGSQASPPPAGGTGGTRRCPTSSDWARIVKWFYNDQYHPAAHLVSFTKRRGPVCEGIHAAALFYVDAYVFVNGRWEDPAIRRQFEVYVLAVDGSSYNPPFNPPWQQYTLVELPMRSGTCAELASTSDEWRPVAAGVRRFMGC
ncbi:hypothetical protein [Catellatospora paridis]|uniref:hypothetical protein n=1 Tax=Catellatospora paridis TaxID=1617086 RepID=UPI0012D44950|nr:hypothetical protein [Catellatospora paridis]